MPVEGEVSAPGVYQVQPDQTLRDVIAAAGGLTPGAYLYATDLRRESARLEQKDRLAVMVSHLEADIASRAASTDAHATPEEVDAQKSELAAQQQYLEKNGVDPSSVKTIELPFAEMGPALARGTVAGAVISEPSLRDRKSVV